MKLHIIPVRDTKDGERVYHAASMACCCYPIDKKVKSNKDGSIHHLIGHNAFDLREKWERQDMETPGWVAVEEI